MGHYVINKYDKNNLKNMDKTKDTVNAMAVNNIPVRNSSISLSWKFFLIACLSIAQGMVAKNSSGIITGVSWIINFIVHSP